MAITKEGGVIVSNPPPSDTKCGTCGKSALSVAPSAPSPVKVKVLTQEAARQELAAPGLIPGSLQALRLRRAAGLIPDIGWADGRDSKPSTLIPEFEAAVSHISSVSLPDPTLESGVVICAGGWRFFPALYVSVKMLREVGCDWPIQVWYFAGRGEFEPRMAEVLDDSLTTWKPVEDLGLTSSFRQGTPGGWQLKTVAMLHSPFARTLGLDADCYPVRDPVAHLVDRAEVQESGAAFWPDIPSGPGIMTADHFAALGLPFLDDRNWEVGQMYVDKSRRSHREALWLASWLAFRPESQQYSYGDCGCFQMAFRKLWTTFWMHAGRPKWIDVAFLHMGPDGEPLWVHRCRDKPRLPGNGKAYNTPQTHGDLPIVCSYLPAEDRMHAHYQDLLRRLQSPSPEQPGKDG